MRNWILFHVAGLILFTMPIVLGLNLLVSGIITWPMVLGAFLGWLIVVVPLGIHHHYTGRFN